MRESFRVREAKKAVRSNIYGLIARINKRTEVMLSKIRENRLKPKN